MPHFHRYYIENHPIFITCVTNNRIPYLQGKENLELFWGVLRNVQKLHPFHLHSYVILPDHFHWIMELPENQWNFSVIMHSIKNNYTRLLKEKLGIQKNISNPVWQKRFWDHIIRNENDFDNIFDYIHWNPVKHGYVRNPAEWQQSSFRFWCDKGAYPSEWGCQGMPAHLVNLDLD